MVRKVLVSLRGIRYLNIPVKIISNGIYLTRKKYSLISSKIYCLKALRFEFLLEHFMDIGSNADNFRRCWNILEGFDVPLKFLKHSTYEMDCQLVCCSVTVEFLEHFWTSVKNIDNSEGTEN